MDSSNYANQSNYSSAPTQPGVPTQQKSSHAGVIVAVILIIFLGLPFLAFFAIFFGISHIVKEVGDGGFSINVNGIHTTTSSNVIAVAKELDKLSESSDEDLSLYRGDCKGFEAGIYDDESYQSVCKDETISVKREEAFLGDEDLSVLKIGNSNYCSTFVFSDNYRKTFFVMQSEDVESCGAKEITLHENAGLSVMPKISDDEDDDDDDDDSIYKYESDVDIRLDDDGDGPSVVIRSGANEQ